MSDDDLVTEAHLLEIVENQLTENNPQRVKETLLRLTMTGMERQEAMDYIACALSVEIIDIIQNSATFNLKRYEQNLDKLPDTPWMTA
ncbi:hypothetical protein [Endozoicomonas numazuensis]|uniref:Uncharacterized protein n=1 Tax=Endozoicomonas numazuensis TaxID=1137799 RepID=A0A081N6K8_9GAMM|nr:hypothetical protein [Endozoicomonas numazuensis]KEQ14081.1 hypothetical protein GZ78_25990 [Endozoicomonas numazuensis]